MFFTFLKGWKEGKGNETRKATETIRGLPSPQYILSGPFPKKFFDPVLAHLTT